MFLTHRPSWLCRFGLMMSLAGALIASPSTAQTSDPNQLRAAIVFNVLRFVEFPIEQGGTIEFCVAAEAPENAALRSLSGRRAGARPVLVRTIRGGSYGGCDVVFLSSADSDQIERASGRGRLLIGNGRSFVVNGGAVGLVQNGSQVRFQLNLRAASQSKVVISSRLIRLASKVTR